MDLVEITKAKELFQQQSDALVKCCAIQKEPFIRGLALGLIDAIRLLSTLPVHKKPLTLIEKCSFCGKQVRSELEDSYNFCPYCGKEL